MLVWLCVLYVCCMCVRLCVPSSSSFPSSYFLILFYCCCSCGSPFSSVFHLWIIRTSKNWITTTPKQNFRNAKSFESIFFLFSRKQKLCERARARVYVCVSCAHASVWLLVYTCYSFGKIMFIMLPLKIWNHE